MISIEELMESIDFLKEQGDVGWTRFHIFGRDDENVWAIVFAWSDGYDESSLITGKVAYQHINSIMQEYDIDWIMPYDKRTGEVWDNEVCVGNEKDLQWLIDIANQYLKLFNIKEVA